MAISTYRTGQAAKILNVSSYHLRRLCEAGKVDGERTDGNQWKIPVSEVERLQKEGVPPIPQVLEEAEPNPPRPAASTRPDHSPSPEVQKAKESVEITQSQLQRRQIELQREELEDRFRERARKEERNAWLNRWREKILASLPYDVQPDVRMAVTEASEDVLSKLTPRHPESVQKAQINAVIQRGLTVHEREKSIAQAISGLPDKRKSEGRALAVSSVEALGPTANYFQMTRAAENAVGDLARRSEHEAKVDRSMRNVSFYCALNEVEETDTVRAAVRSALDSAPLGSSYWDLSQRQTEAIERFKSSEPTNLGVATKHDLQQMVTRISQATVAKVRANQAILYFNSYLHQNYVEVSQPEENSMRSQLHVELARRFEVGELQSVTDAELFIERWVDENIELDDEDDSEEEDSDDDDWDDDDDPDYEEDDYD